nr:RNA-directed DNA polymerase, eukaryota [Tanacetum cinerariifolium]
MAGRARTNVDHTWMISKSICVTNFPDNTTSKDLWEVCKGYGIIVDVFIPNRRTKAGKRFAFVRFIKVDNVDRLVGTLCTLWIGRMHLHANVVRFKRASLQSPRPSYLGKSGYNASSSFASVLKGIVNPEPTTSLPAIVIDESYVVHRDLGNFVVGEVKQFASIANLRVILSNEGFHNVNITYLGGLWVMVELCSAKIKEKFLNHMGVTSWFNSLSNAQHDFVLKERIVWVNIEGVPLHVWSRATFCKIASKWGETPKFTEVTDETYCSDDDSDKGDAAIIGGKGVNCQDQDLDKESDVEGVSDTVFEELEENLEKAQENSVNDKEPSSDPFNIYDLLQKRKAELNQSDLNSSFSHPRVLLLIRIIKAIGDLHNFPVDSTPKRDLHKGGSILEVLDGMIKVGQSMGFSMRGCLQDMENTIGSQGGQQGDANGNSGGILCIWDVNVFQKDQHILSDNFVALYGTWVPKKTKLLIVSAYAPQPASDKRTLWNFISGLISRWNGECLIMGDFNEVRFESERLGSVFNTQGANEFNNFISNAGLVDIQLEDYGDTPSRFYHSWLSLQGFDLMVASAWNSFALKDSNGMVQFKKKLQMFKQEIQNCVAAHKHNQSGVRNDIRSKLSDIDKILDQGGVTDEVLSSHLSLMNQLQDIKSNFARDQMQKAKIQRAIEGDENSKFFHRIVNRKRVHLSVKGIMVDGEWVDEPTRVKEDFRSHFASQLEKSVSSDEIRKAVWSCGENKSPGPDGFSLEFFRKFWDLIGPDMCIAVDWFFTHNSFSRGYNASFISLIPKVHDPMSVSDFRPISLIGSLYKVVTKILATRLSLVISDLISEVQTPFLSNRQILDGPFIINELISWCRHRKQQAMVFKVDFAKAYDSIQWNYLGDVLKSFRFGVKWRSWIAGSLSSGMASILFNGSPTS